VLIAILDRSRVTRCNGHVDGGSISLEHDKERIEIRRGVEGRREPARVRRYWLGGFMDIRTRLRHLERGTERTAAAMPIQFREFQPPTG